MTRSGEARGRYNRDFSSTQLGTGVAAFERSKDALRHWAMFDLGWLHVSPPHAQIAEGTVVAVIVRHFGFWSVNFCRIVYVIDEPRRFGFAYGTLMKHAESGEERFTVTSGQADDAVSFEILALSRPRHPLAKIAYPLSRALQKRFVRDALAAMQRAVRV